MTKITIERETLLPCPFCGCGAAITGTEWDGREQYFVACTGPDCHCAVGENYDRDACPEYSFSSKDDAIAAWNRRAALAAQPAEPAYTHADVAEAHAKGYALGLRQVDRPQPAGAQQEPNMRHPKIQALIGKNARQHIWMMLVEQLVEDPHFETTAMDMEYWDTLHDKLKEKLTAAQPAPAAVPLTDEKIDHTLATTLDEFARTTRGMSHALDVNADITANSRLRRMFARAVLAAGDKP